MKRAVVSTCMAAALVAAFLLGRAGAQEENDMMAVFKELATPGPEHAALMKGAGTWTCEAREFQQDGTVKVTKGKAVRTEAFGGRFLKEDYEGEARGQPFHGVSYSGFNKATRKYELVWVSSMGTDIMFMTGTETEAGKTWEFKCNWTGPGGMQGSSRIVSKKVSDDQVVMDMYNDLGMGEIKSMEMTYARAK